MPDSGLLYHSTAWLGARLGIAGYAIAVPIVARHCPRGLDESSYATRKNDLFSLWHGVTCCVNCPSAISVSLSVCTLAHICHCVGEGLQTLNLLSIPTLYNP